MDYTLHQLAKAFVSLKTEKEVAAFLRDLLTVNEIKEFSNRLEIARLLYQGKLSYIAIAKKCGTSTTTVTRVNDWLNNQGLHGYKTVLDRIS